MSAWSRKTIVGVMPSLIMDRAKGIWYLSPMRATKVQASLRIRAVSPEPSLLAHTSSESRGTFRQKARSLAPLNGWACAVEICHDGMLEDTNSLDGALIIIVILVGGATDRLRQLPLQSDGVRWCHLWFPDCMAILCVSVRIKQGLETGSNWQQQLDNQRLKWNRSKGVLIESGITYVNFIWMNVVWP